MRLAAEATVTTTKTKNFFKGMLLLYSQPAINLYIYEARDIQSIPDRIVSVYTSQEK